MWVTLDKESKIPLYEQLYRAARAQLAAGRMRQGERLLSKRALAAALKISVMTVETAYAQLEAEGYICAKSRSGFYVRFDARESDAALGSLGNLKEAVPPPEGASAGPFAGEAPPCRWDFRTGAVDTALFPFATWARLGREVLAQSPGELLNTTHPQGSPGLRRQIADYLYAHRGVRAEPGQIVVGAGSEYILGLLVLLLGQTTMYAVENPGYGKIFRLLQSHGVRTVPVPVDEGGLRVDCLRESRATVAHVTPSHQFPTGAVMPAGRRAQLLAWAAEAPGRYILEDDYDSEFRYAGQPIPALQGMGGAERVIYFNSFTASLAPSLRIGYLVLPLPLLEAFRRRFYAYACTVSHFEQDTLRRFLERGYFERHISRMRVAYRERRDALLAALDRTGLINRVEPRGYDAGLHLLLRADNGMDEAELVRAAEKAGVRVRGLSEFALSPSAPVSSATAVLGFGGMTAENVGRGVDALAGVW